MFNVVPLVSWSPQFLMRSQYYLQIVVLLFVMCLFSPMAAFKMLPFLWISTIWPWFASILCIYLNSSWNRNFFFWQNLCLLPNLRTLWSLFLKIIFPLFLYSSGISIIYYTFPQVPKALIVYPKIFSLFLQLDTFYWFIFKLTDSIILLSSSFSLVQ